MVPRLWEQTIAGHRHAVRDAALDAVGDVVAERGFSGVSMSTIAERTGIARATLYKYFVDADAVVVAWHEREIGRHLDQLRRLAEGDGDPMARLERVLGAYGHIRRGRDHGPTTAALHAGQRVVEAEDELVGFLESLVRDAAATGAVRGDVAAAELAAYCVHALAAAASLPKAAVDRLVAVTIDGLRKAT